MGAVTVLRLLLATFAAAVCLGLQHTPRTSPFLAKARIASSLHAKPRALLVAAANTDVDDDFYIQDTYQPERPAYPSTRRRAASGPAGLQLPSFQGAGNGIVFLIVGLLATVVGMSLFFDRTLIRIGTICLLIGVPTTFGVDATVRTLTSPQRLHATACLVAGVFLVMVGRSFFGVLLEIFGFLNLFGNMFPLLLAMARNLPVVGQLLNPPSRPRPNNFAF